MPIFIVKQVVSHPLQKNLIIKTSKVIGEDLGHAVEMIRCSPTMMQELKRKYKTKSTDMKGRTVEIEIIEEEKA